jgi:DNA-binding transcriptional ArsR family regulator
VPPIPDSPSGQERKIQNPKSKIQNPDDPLAGALAWDYGTAYEMLLSLDTLSRPKVHGVPAPWAAGVRKRLSPQSQAAIKNFLSPTFGVLAYLPLHLVLQMDPPKTGARFLAFVEGIPDGEFSQRVHVPLVGDGPHIRIIRKALNGERVNDAEMEEYRRAVGRTRVLPAPTASEARRLFAEMADPAATKRRWLEAMREYHAVFFAQEEARLEPVLKHMVEEAKKLSKTAHVSDLIERLSNGFTISEESTLQRLTLVPSVWLHPFVIPLRLSELDLLLVWGAHPPGYKLAPGESVPEQSLLVLRALGDPTRLRLLRLLSSEPRSPQALAHELKLSLPTVSHHMRELRLAGLVRLEARIGDKGRENRYTVRWQSAEQAFTDLGQFVQAEDT